jgi:hypothetical protein
MAALQNESRLLGVGAEHAPDAIPCEPAPGFAIRLPSAQLGDLIQINCLNRIRGAFRVSSAASEGFLFFDAGQLVHAMCEASVGLDAVVIMLGWRGGSIEPCSVPFPGECSIGMGADALLLHAAQRLDERLRSEAPRADVTTKVVRRVAWPDEVPTAAPPAISPAPEASAQAQVRPSEQSGLSLRSTLSLESLSRLEVARVAGDGNIQRLAPGATADLADTAFYCEQLGSAIGVGLGLGACRALACENTKEGLVVFTGRSIVGVRGKHEDLELVLQKVGLG